MRVFYGQHAFLEKIIDLYDDVWIGLLFLAVEIIEMGMVYYCSLFWVKKNPIDAAIK